MLIYTWLMLIFLLGLTVGSALNVLIYRLPLGKSVIWPSSRCGYCLTPIRWHDNLPILGYLLVLGRCRHCRQAISWRYPLVELLCGLGWAAGFVVEVMLNAQHFPIVTSLRVFIWDYGAVPLPLWAIVLSDGLAVTLLLLAFFCWWDRRPVPLPVVAVIWAIVVGLNVLFPWPAPNVPVEVILQSRTHPQVPLPGLQLASVWHPMPKNAIEGEPWVGLLGAVAGSCAGWCIFRLLRGIGGPLSLGEAALWIWAGALLGWQGVLLLWPIVMLLLAGWAWLMTPRGPLALFLGLSLPTLRYTWPHLGQSVYPWLVHGWGIGSCVGVALLATAAYALAVRRWGQPVPTLAEPSAILTHAAGRPDQCTGRYCRSGTADDGGTTDSASPPVDSASPPNQHAEQQNPQTETTGH